MGTGNDVLLFVPGAMRLVSSLFGLLKSIQAINNFKLPKRPSFRENRVFKQNFPNEARKGFLLRLFFGGISANSPVWGPFRPSLILTINFRL